MGIEAKKVLKEYLSPQTDEFFKIMKKVKKKEIKLPNVHTSNMNVIEYDPIYIVKNLVKETKMAQSTAERIASTITTRLMKMYIYDEERSIFEPNFLSARMIREMACSWMAEKGFVEARKKYTVLGIPFYNVNQLINDPLSYTSNANLQQSPETIFKVVADNVFKQKTLLSLPERLMDFHMKCGHIKDLEYFETRDYCADYDPREIFRQGIAPDGMGGMHSSKAKPAKWANTAVNHLEIWLGSAQSNMSGGQSFRFLNVFLAPFLKGASYKEIKQAYQQLVFLSTQAYVARGGQVVFAVVGICPGCPDFLKNVGVTYLGKTRENDEYGDYEREIRLGFIALMELMYFGDDNGKPFNYPKLNVVLRHEYMGNPFNSSLKPTDDEKKKEKFDFDIENVSFDDCMKAMMLVTAHSGSLYFENYLKPEYARLIGASSSCCSHTWHAQDEEQWQRFLNGTLVHGASAMVTPNIVQASWLGRKDEGNFYEIIDDFLDMSKDICIQKHNILQRLCEKNIVPFYTQKMSDGTPLIKPEERAYLIGILGVAEMVEIATGSELQERNGYGHAFKVLNHIKKRTKEYSEDTGLNFGVTRQPAETSSGRIAYMDYIAYPEMRSYIRGKAPDELYYTNSTHLPVETDIPLLKKIKIESMFHPQLDGGAMTHIFLGEAHPSWESLWKLIMNVTKNTLTRYFAITKDYELCFDCKLMRGIDYSDKKYTDINFLLNSKCPNCSSSNYDVYSRITGYVQGVKRTWNKHKKREFVERKRYSTNV